MNISSFLFEEEVDCCLVLIPHFDKRTLLHTQKVIFQILWNAPIVLMKLPAFTQLLMLFLLFFRSIRSLASFI